MNKPACMGIALLALSAGLGLARAEESGFTAGAYAQDITPSKFPVSVNGGMQDVQAKSAHDRIHARCLVIRDGKSAVAIAICDSCMIPREIFDEAKRLAEMATGIPASNMLMAATHTHSAPTVGGVFQSDPNPDYVKELPGRIAAGIARADKARVPAKVGFGSAMNRDQVFNRRWRLKPGTIMEDPFGGTTDVVKMNPGYKAPGIVEPAGPIDPEVSVLSLQTLEGKPLALLANYSLHYVGGLPPLSADYFGAFADQITGLIQADSKFVGIMSNGTSGDCNNVNFAGDPPGRREPGQQIRVVAQSVAQTALSAYKKTDHQAKGTVAAAEGEIELGVRKPSASDLARARTILQAAPAPLKTLAQIYARETILLDKYPEKVKVKLQALRIGPVAIAAIPCEVFAEIGLDLKARSAVKPMFTIELANGYNGYLPTPQQHKWGGYETWRARSSYLEVDASTRITATLLELLAAVKDR